MNCFNRIWKKPYLLFCKFTDLCSLMHGLQKLCFIWLLHCLMVIHCIWVSRCGESNGILHFSCNSQSPANIPQVPELGGECWLGYEPLQQSPRSPGALYQWERISWCFLRWSWCLRDCINCGILLLLIFQVSNWCWSSLVGWHLSGLFGRGRWRCWRGCRLRNDGHVVWWWRYSHLSLGLLWQSCIGIIDKISFCLPPDGIVDRIRRLK